MCKKIIIEEKPVNMMQVSAIALLGAVALLFFKQYKPEWSIPLRLIIYIVLGGVFLSMVQEVISFINASLLSESSVAENLWPVLLKALGISFVTEIAAGVCRDSGEGTLALWVESAGRMFLLILALPLVEEILKASRTLLDISA